MAMTESFARPTGAPEPDVTLTEVDGVRVAYVDTPGPLRASLMFRVGQADETLPTHGITHLAEHVTLSGTEQPAHAFNGFTGSVFTSFVVAGDEEQVTEYLRQVTSGLSAPQLDRVDHECGVMRVEASQRGGAAAQALSSWRWGPRTHGLLGFDEFFLHRPDCDQLGEWIGRWFTRDNAVLLLSGPPPAGLRLQLPGAGAASPGALPPLDAVIPLAGCFTYRNTGVGFTYLTWRGAAGSVLPYVLQQRLQARLRHELGVSYSVAVGVDRVSPETSVHAFFADCLPDNAATVQAAVVDVLQQLRDEPLRPDERAQFESLRAMMNSDASARALGHLDYVGRELLLGSEPKSAAEIERELDNLRDEDMRAAVDAALASLLLAVPDAAKVPTDLAQPAPMWSATAVTGQTVAPTARHGDKRVSAVVLGRDGVSVLAGGHAVTVRYDDTAGMLCYDDGARTLINHAGFMVKLNPEDWTQPDTIREAVDAGVPSDRRIPAGPRQAPPAEPAPGATPASSKRGMNRAVAARVLLTLLAVAAVAIALATGNAGAPLFFGIVILVRIALNSWRHRQ